MAATTLLSDNGVTSGITGYRLTGGNDGTLQLQTTTSGGTATTAVTINNSQNVGIGVTPSAWGSGRTAFEAGNYLYSSSLYTNELLQNAYFNGTNWIYRITAAASRFQVGSGAFAWFTAPSGTAGNPITFTQAMTLDASGNLGIGTTSPSTHGTLAVDTSKGATGVVFGDLATPANDTSLYLRSTGNSIIATGSTGNLVFKRNGPAGTEAMRIDSSGNLLVGTTVAGVGGLGVSVGQNINFAESATTAYATIFRQASSAALTLNYGYAWSATASGWASSIGTSTARSTIKVSNGTIGFYTDTASTVAVGTGITPTERMRIDSSGNLGLGVTPSAWYSNVTALQIGNRYGSIFGGSGYSSSPNIAVASNVYAISSTGVDTYIASAVAAKYAQGAGAHKWYISTDVTPTAGNAITFTQAMTLDASGNLGVGTSSPSNGAKLDVAGAVISTAATLSSFNANNAGFDFNASTKEGRFFATSTNTTGGVMTFTTGQNGSYAERMRIDSIGYLLLGQTSYGVPSGTSFQITPTYTLSGHVSGTASGQGYAYYYYNANNIGSITQNGTTGVLYNTSSDYRLKDITGPVTGEEAKNFIMALQPKQGSWKADGSKFVGFVAHEFQEVSPSSVTGEKDAVDEEGNPVMQAMQASSPEVMANLVALIQEQQAIIETLKARLDAANL